jgi:LPS-assembly lipoprotein
MTARRRFLSASVSVLKAGVLWSAGGVLTGCGFQLRQAPAFAFQTLVAPLPDTSPLRRELKLGLQSAGVTVLHAPPPPPNPQADAVLEILGDQREKSVVGSTTAGQVREFQLKLRFRFKLSTPKGKELIPDTEVLVQRDISYSESIALSKAEEEAELYRDMQTDVVQQVLRRLAALRSL